MSFHSLVKITGELTVQKFNSEKELIEQIHIPNLVVAVGKQHIAARMVDDSETKMSHMSIGSGQYTPNIADTTLINELDRVELTALRTGANVNYTATFGVGIGTGSITEAGIFNDALAGDMLCRTTFPVITKSASETISISWTVTVG